LDSGFFEPLARFFPSFWFLNPPCGFLTPDSPHVSFHFLGTTIWGGQFIFFFPLITEIPNFLISNGACLYVRAGCVFFFYDRCHPLVLNLKAGFPTPRPPKDSFPSPSPLNDLGLFSLFRLLTWRSAFCKFLRYWSRTFPLRRKFPPLFRFFPFMRNLSFAPPPIERDRIPSPY